jgi:hypothetical protein
MRSGDWAHGTIPQRLEGRHGVPPLFKPKFHPTNWNECGAFPESFLGEQCSAPRRRLATAAQDTILPRIGDWIAEKSWCHVGGRLSEGFLG